MVLSARARVSYRCLYDSAVVPFSGMRGDSASEEQHYSYYFRACRLYPFGSRRFGVGPCAFCVCSMRGAGAWVCGVGGVIVVIHLLWIVFNFQIGITGRG